MRSRARFSELVATDRAARIGVIAGRAWQDLHGVAGVPHEMILADPALAFAGDAVRAAGVRAPSRFG